MVLETLVKPLPSSGPVSLMGIEGLGLGNLLGSLGFWVHMRLPMTHGKELKPQKRRVEGDDLIPAPSQKIRATGKPQSQQGACTFVCVRVRVRAYTHMRHAGMRHPWPCPSVSSPGHCLPSPEPPGVSPGNWWLAPGPLSFSHHGLYVHLCSALEVSRVPSLSPEIGACLCLAQEGKDLRSYSPTNTTLCHLYPSAPHFSINILSTSQVF